MIRFLNVLVLAIFLGLLLCCHKGPTKPDNRPWYVSTDHEPTWSPDGKQIAYASGGNSTQTVPDGLYIVDLATRHRRFILPGYGHLYDPHWSPNGKWIAISLFVNIYKVTPQGDSLVQLTHGKWESSPRWSPDGQHIVFHRDLGVDGGVWMIDPDGAAETKVRKWALYPDWFSNGEELAVYAYDSLLKSSRIARYTLADSVLHFLAPPQEAVGENSLRVSLDGKYVLFGAQEQTNPPRLSLFTVEVKTGRVRHLLAGAAYGAWSPDGRYLAYTNCYDGAIYVWDLQADTTVQVSPGILVFEPDWDSTGFPKVNVGSR